METVLITGASRGIGLELTRQFLTLGFNVIATYRKKPSTELVTLGSTGALTLVELEVTDNRSISQLCEHLKDTKVDILINNAGVIGPENQSLDTINTDSWVQTFTVNSIAPLMVSRALLNNLLQAPNPRIIAISSLMGALCGEGMGMYAYRSSKTAVNKVMQLLSLELKEQGITVCPIHPGWVQTDMGGSDADISVQESASGIVDFACKLTIEQTGKFFTWQGEEHNW